MVSYTLIISAKPTSKTRRAAGQTTLTISIPEELKADIEAAASEEQRSTSNYLVVELAKLIAAKKAEITHSPKGKTGAKR